MENAGMAECIAVYGGSFDPPHLGHSLVCAYVLSAYRIDRLLVMPVGTHPFSKRLAAFEHRQRMCELAFARLQDVEVSVLERDLPGPSLTLHTLQHLSAQHPRACLRLVIGSDLLGQISSWFEFERVRALAPLLVVPRVGYESPDAPGPAIADINSSDLRARLRSGAETAGLLNPDVAQYALQHRLYAADV
jgi:nicotinate-nucleotide adenylyltransferase